MTPSISMRWNERMISGETTIREDARGWETMIDENWGEVDNLAYHWLDLSIFINDDPIGWVLRTKCYFLIHWLMEQQSHDNRHLYKISGSQLVAMVRISIVVYQLNWFKAGLDSLILVVIRLHILRRVVCTSTYWHGGIVQMPLWASFGAHGRNLIWYSTWGIS